GALISPALSCAKPRSRPSRSWRRSISCSTSVSLRINVCTSRTVLDAWNRIGAGGAKAEVRGLLEDDGRAAKHRAVPRWHGHHGRFVAAPNRESGLRPGARVRLSPPRLGG